MDEWRTELLAIELWIIAFAELMFVMKTTREAI